MCVSQNKGFSLCVVNVQVCVLHNLHPFSCCVYIGGSFGCCAMHCVCVCCGKDFASSPLSFVTLCTLEHVYIPNSFITNSPHRSPFPSPLCDLVKHPIISLIIAMLVESSLPRALPRLPDLLGNPEGDLELNSQPFSH